MITEEFASLRKGEAKEFVKNLSNDSLEELKLKMGMIKDDVEMKFILIKKEIERRKSI